MKYPDKVNNDFMEILEIFFFFFLYFLYVTGLDVKMDLISIEGYELSV